MAFLHRGASAGSSCPCCVFEHSKVASRWCDCILLWRVRLRRRPVCKGSLHRLWPVFMVALRDNGL